MNEKYLGDSYDIVKRFWADILGPIAPLYVYPEFIPEPIRIQFTQLTRMQFYKSSMSQEKRQFGIFLDPDTGFRHPSAKTMKFTVKHVGVDCLRRLYDEIRPEYMVCFDQSFTHGRASCKQDKMAEKCKAIRQHGLHAFYFDSHASFLFISDEEQTLGRIAGAISAAGIPNTRLRELNLHQSSPR